jgi:hypothetical protein
MLHEKSHYLKMEHHGYKWVGFWDGHHQFQHSAVNKNHMPVYKLCSVLEKDITDNSVDYMCKNGLTRIIKSSDKD